MRDECVELCDVIVFVRVICVWHVCAYVCEGVHCLVHVCGWFCVVV